jgi:ribonuclease D
MKIKFIGPDRPFSDIPTATMDECLSYCRDRSVLGVDTETSGLDFTKEKLLMLQIGDRDLQFVIDVRYVDISVLTPILESEHILKIFQNVKFDYKFILNEGIVLENVYDTMLVEKILYCGYPDVRVSLADICRRRLNVTLNKRSETVSSE